MKDKLPLIVNLGDRRVVTFSNTPWGDKFSVLIEVKGKKGALHCAIVLPKDILARVSKT